MKNLLVIKSLGEIQEEAITLLGASTKRDSEGKIGMFGSGNKYAIATLLKEGVSFQIFSGKKEVKISLVNKTFREKEFNIISVNGKETSITTETGLEWSPVDSVREFYANAEDEGFICFKKIEESTKDAYIQEGATCIFVDCSEKLLKDFWENRWRYFSFARKMEYRTVSGELKAYRAPLNNTPNICYNYFNIYEFEKSEKKMLFDYDYIDAEISENRKAKNPSLLKFQLGRLIAEIKSYDYWKELILNNAEELRVFHFESALFDKNHPVVKLFSEEDYYVVPASYRKITKLKGEMLSKNCFAVPDSMYNSIFKYPGVKTILSKGSNMRLNVSEVPEGKYKHILDKAKKELREVGVFFEHDIFLTEFPDKNLHAVAEDGNVYISPKYLDKSTTEEIASCLMEEDLHITHNFSDCSREFQNFLFSEMFRFRKLYFKLKRKLGE